MFAPTLQFYLGRAGSGKTRRCLDEIAARLRDDPSPRGGPLLWLLPEQATAQAERMLLAEPGIRGFARAGILSFKRLAQRVLAETGGAPRPWLDEQGRRMLLRALVARHADSLRLFAKSAREKGFIARLARTFTELAQFRHSFDDLEREALRLETESGDDPARHASPRRRRAFDPLLALKLRDLATLGRAWEAEFGTRFDNPDRFLDDLARRIGKSSLLDRAEVWIDGFASFMPQEMRVLREILGHARAVRVSLLLDPRELDSLASLTPDASSGPVASPNPVRLFAETEETYLKLRAAALDLGVEILESVVFPTQESSVPRFAECPALATLEANLAESGMMAAAPQKAAPHAVAAQASPPATVQVAALEDLPSMNSLPSPLPPIVCMEAAGPREEVEAVARAIRRLCREEGERYRDVALILRDLDSYQSLIRSVFKRHAIPYFIDRRRAMSHHPLVEMLRSALRVATDDWNQEDVIQYLKTDLAPVGRFNADAIENYALAHGVRGREWWVERAWRDAAQPEEDDIPSPGPGPRGKEGDSAFEIRKRALAPLVSLQDALHGLEARATSFVAALGRLLEELGCASKIQRWIETALAEGNPDLADEHAQVWEGVTGLLEQTVRSLGDATMPVPDLADAFETGLSELTLGLVPPSLDQVLVGTVERSRQPDLRTVFVLGVNERVFPFPRGEDAIFTDSEREALSESGGFDLAPSSTVHLLRERYLGYVALTRASRRLWVSWSAADEEGRAMQPSSFVHALLHAARSCAPPPALVRIGARWLDESPDSLETAQQAVEGLARAQRPPSRLEAREREAWDILERRIGAIPGAAERLENARLGLGGDRAAQLEPGAGASALLDAGRPVSVSRLETFAQCPYRYFARYALGLGERARFEIAPIEVGTFHHEILKETFEILRAELGEEFRGPTPEGLAGPVLDWGKVSPEAARRALDEAIDRRRGGFLAEGPLKDPQTRFLVERTRDILRRVLTTFIRQGADDSFVQAAAEAGFGFCGSRLPALSIPLGKEGAIVLHGKIDRIDLAWHDGGEVFARVIDFKSAEKRLSIGRAIQGFDLQLPLYLRALVAAGKGALRPAGMFFFPVRRQQRFETAPPEDETESDAREDLIQARGAFDVGALPLFGRLEPGQRSPYVGVALKKDGQPSEASPVDWLAKGLLESLCARACGEAARLGREILAGRIDVSPVRQGSQVACVQCPYGDVCRIDPRTGAFRPVLSLKRRDALQALAEGDRPTNRTNKREEGIDRPRSSHSYYYRSTSCFSDKKLFCSRKGTLTPALSQGGEGV